MQKYFLTLIFYSQSKLYGMYFVLIMYILYDLSGKKIQIYANPYSTYTYYFRSITIHYFTKCSYNSSTFTKFTIFFITVKKKNRFKIMFIISTQYSK